MIFSQTGSFGAAPLAIARQNDLSGFLDAQGRWKITPRFASARPFAANGLAAASPGDAPNQWGYINASGAWVIPARFDSAGDFASNGLAPASQEGKHGFLDHQGRWAVAPQFEQARPFAGNGLVE